MSERILITGIGFILPVGIGKEAAWQALINGCSGIAPIARFDTSALNCRVAGEVKDWESNPLSKDPSRFDRVIQFALGAAKLAIEDAGLTSADLGNPRTGVSMGTGLGGIWFAESQLKSLYENGTKKVSPITVPNVNPNAISTQIAMEWQCSGINMTVCTACASGAHAIGQAMDAMRLGRADIMIVGGAEAPLTPLSFTGFDNMRVMACHNGEPDKACRPFDKGRNGFVLGEGAGVLILETESHARRRGARAYAELCGYGASCGGYHLVAPQPDGRDAAISMERALSDAQLNKEEIGYINAHGTSTKANDLVETMVVKKVFGEMSYQVPLSSTKSMTGHLIGAAGAVEAAITALAIYHGMLPPTINYETPDPECDLDYVPTLARQVHIKAALSNSFAFGNNNACLAFRKAP